MYRRLFSLRRFGHAGGEVVVGFDFPLPLREYLYSSLTNAEGVCKFQPRATPWVSRRKQSTNSERVRKRQFQT